MNFGLGDVFRNFKNNEINNQVDKTTLDKNDKENAQSIKKYAVPELPDEEVILGDDSHEIRYETMYGIPRQHVEKYAVPDLSEPSVGPTEDIHIMKYAVPPMLKYAIPDEPAQTESPIISMYAIYPSEEPIPVPTDIIVSEYAVPIEPTVTPSVEPTATVEPTVTPTVEPTTEPTVTPTVTPTTAPEPTVQPTPGTTVTQGVRYNPFSFNLSSIFGNSVFGRFFGGLNSRLNNIITKFFFKL